MPKPAGKKKYSAGQMKIARVAPPRDKITGAPQPGGGARKRSFCARMSGMKGPLKKPNGKPTRKALALRRWKC